VDISRPLLQRAEQRARHDGLTNVRFEHGDAQTYRLAPQGFDVAISRFGVMFFSDPTAAFANIARGLRPGGRIAFVCWQPLANNEWITMLASAAAQHIPLPPPDEPGSPGPFSLGDRQHLAAVLDAAGLVDVAIQPVVESLWLVETSPTPSNSSKRAGSAKGCSKTPTPQRAPGSWRRCRPRWSPI
jgi:SAM-dependent methyltransferase